MVLNMTELLGAIRAKIFWKHNVKNSSFARLLERWDPRNHSMMHLEGVLQQFRDQAQHHGSFNVCVVGQLRDPGVDWAQERQSCYKAWVAKDRRPRPLRSPFSKVLQPCRAAFSTEKPTSNYPKSSQ